MQGEGINAEHCFIFWFRCKRLDPLMPTFSVTVSCTTPKAAVKGPEIAVRLVKELNFDVRILLTRGGENFWSKAKGYNKLYWDMLQELLESGDKESGDGTRISIYCK